MNLKFNLQVSRFNIDAIAENDMSNIEVTGAEESLGQIIHNISNEVIMYSTSLSCEDASHKNFNLSFLFSVIADAFQKCW